MYNLHVSIRFWQISPPFDAHEVISDHWSKHACKHCNAVHASWLPSSRAWHYPTFPRYEGNVLPCFFHMPRLVSNSRAPLHLLYCCHNPEIDSCRFWGNIENSIPSHIGASTNYPRIRNTFNRMNNFIFTSNEFDLNGPLKVNGPLCAAAPLTISSPYN